MGGGGRVGAERRVTQRAHDGARVDRRPDLAVGRGAFGGAAPEVGPAGSAPVPRRGPGVARRLALALALALAGRAPLVPRAPLTAVAAPGGAVAAAPSASV